ncbi:MAG TPA: late competence development ComFB family protein [Nitrospirota bacterium]|jgi:hypothetical protein
MSNEPVYKIENANYGKVSYYIDKMLAETDRYCGCARCRMDAVALALNTLPPHYYVDPGNGVDNDLGSPWILIEMASRESLEKVRKNPKHKGAQPAAPAEERLFSSVSLDEDEGGEEVR